MFGWELRRKIPEVNRQTYHPDDDNMACNRDREQKDKMKKYANKRHTSVMRIKVGDTVLCKQEQRNRLTPLFYPVPMIVIGIKGGIITTKNNQQIRTRNYVDWTSLKIWCRQSFTCDEEEDTFYPYEGPAGEG